MSLIPCVFWKLQTQKMWLDKCLKSLVSEDHSISDVVNGPKYCSNLKVSTFTIIIDDCEGN